MNARFKPTAIKPPYNHLIEQRDHDSWWVHRYLEMPFTPPAMDSRVVYFARSEADALAWVQRQEQASYALADRS